jgi:tyrosinase
VQKFISYLEHRLVLKRTKPTRKRSKTNDKLWILDPLSTNYTGALNVYSRMIMRLRPRMEEAMDVELETLPRVNQTKFEEKERFINAFKTIIKNGQFADLISIHSNAYTYRIHTEQDVEPNQRFLPWHRAYLYQLELSLNNTPEGNSKLRIPYWDWTVDRKVPDWLADFRPTIENVLVYPESEDAPRMPVRTTIRVERTPGKQRNPITGRLIELPTQSHVDRLNSNDNFRDFTDYMEGIHGIPHVWVGGTMAHYISPADPLFWLHHANIDRLWNLWPNSQSKLPNLQGENAVMNPWSYRTDRDPIQDTKFFKYTYT